MVSPSSSVEPVPLRMTFSSTLMLQLPSSQRMSVGVVGGVFAVLTFTVTVRFASAQSHSSPKSQAMQLHSISELFRSIRSKVEPLSVPVMATEPFASQVPV